MNNRFGFSDFMNEAYTGTANFGRDTTEVGTVFVFIISVICILIGIFLIFRKSKYTKKVVMTVKSAGEVLDSSNKKVVNVTGTIPDCGSSIVPIKNFNTANKTPGLDDLINVYINPDKPCEDAITNPTNTRTIGVFMIIISLVVCLISYINLKMVRKYKGYAALQGARVGVGVTRSLFRWGR